MSANSQKRTLVGERKRRLRPLDRSLEAFHVKEARLRVWPLFVSVFL